MLARLPLHVYDMRILSLALEKIIGVPGGFNGQVRWT
jgi:hypothetical protein